MARISLKNLYPVMGAIRQRVVVNPLRVGWQRGRLLKDSALNEVQRERMRQVDLRIHHRDDMYFGSAANYLTVGLSAIECIDGVLSGVATQPINNVLDLPSGYGRVLRFLIQRFPGAKITACDLQWEGVDFCVDRFGALPAYSRTDLSEISFEQKFDLIWSGSLVTHLSRATTVELLDLFMRNLNTGGVMIFTTHGDLVVEKMRAGATYNVPKESIERLIPSYVESGYGYCDYVSGFDDLHPDNRGYGVSLTSPDTIRSIAKEVGHLKEVYFKPHGWDNHQDVFAFQKM